MDPEAFREAGHQLIDWIADFRSDLERLPVKSPVRPGAVSGAFPTTPPSELADFAEILTMLDDVIVPGMTHVQHPRYFGWFPANASLSSVLGDLASSGLGGLGLSWESAPALTEVEEVVVDWMRQLTGLSDAWRGTIHDTASTATLVALLVARERATSLSQNGPGLAGAGTSLTVYTTDQAHSSIAKAALLAGYGWDNIRRVDTDPVTSAMVPASLAAAIDADVEAGRCPAAIVAGVGTTGVTAFDPVDEIVAVVDTYAASHPDAPRPWVHADAAMAGSGMLLPELRHLWDGVERADSIVWNPHKWMGTILDCSLFYVRDVAMLEAVMSTNPSYLQSSADGAVTQYRDRGIPLGRRFRALKLWFQLSLEGVEAIQARLRRDLANAAWLAEQVEAADDWELVSPLTLQTVCVRHVPPGLDEPAVDEHNLAWARSLNDSGAAFVSPSQHRGRWMVRISIGALGTERRQVEDLWDRAARLRQPGRECVVQQRRVERGGMCRAGSIRFLVDDGGCRARGVGVGRRAGLIGAGRCRGGPAGRAEVVTEPEVVPLVVDAHRQRQTESRLLPTPTTARRSHRLLRRLPPGPVHSGSIEQTSRVDGGFKTLVVFEVSGCESTNIEAVEGMPDKRTDNVRFYGRFQAGRAHAERHVSRSRGRTCRCSSRRSTPTTTPSAQAVLHHPRRDPVSGTGVPPSV